ncbi:PARP catalytic domain-containing protein [Mycena indigotica]|uniref:PARP catalytic domain-containing protein n=1 Tax=Mycena indigotica TaxID=2126181 RepID=A0A8H6S412_9AGAR|nr:PARP catalytic domain-containing protein [Mycena indigotica]KAF7292775.1 PARP catalytic domain-containing protein [Mycena indigotica]
MSVDDDEIIVLSHTIPSHKRKAFEQDRNKRKKTKIINLTFDSESDDNNDHGFDCIVSKSSNLETDASASRHRESELRQETWRAVKGGPSKLVNEPRNLRQTSSTPAISATLIKSVEKRREGIVFRISVDVETKLLEDGTPAHDDDLARFQPWKDRLAASGIKVKKFHWIVNYELEKRFEAAREILRRNMKGEEPKELHMFHGTAPKNIESILNGGFKIGGVGGHAHVNGHCEGYGVYLAQDFNLSLGHAAGATRIFACRVLPGRSTDSIKYSNTIPRRAVCSGKYESYSGTPGMLVVRHTALVLPCYMIEYEPYNGGLYPYGFLLPPLMGGVYGIGAAAVGAPGPGLRGWACAPPLHY